MKCTYLRSCLLGNFSFFLGFLPNLQGLLRFAFSQVLEAKSRISFCKEKGELFLAFGGAGYTSRSYQFGNSSPFCIFSFCWEEFLNYSWVLLSQSLWTPFSVISCAIERSRERPLRASAASCLWVLLLSTAASPFSSLLSPYRQIICLPRNALAVWYGSRSSWWANPNQSLDSQCYQMIFEEIF